MKLTLLLTSLLFCLPSFGKILKPKSVKDFEKASVMVLNKEMNSGGSGSIIFSNKNGSHILTNKHVCRLVEQGGYVAKGDYVFEVTHYKKYSLHDLCLVFIKENLGISLSISNNLASSSDRAYISGHPGLMPHIVKSGHLSKNIDISLVVGLRECKKTDFKDYEFECFFLGGVPIFETFSSVFTSILIQPGSSGSGVFNSAGELVGVAFAGTGRSLSYGFIVPHIHLHYFLKTQHLQKYIKVGTPVDNKGMSVRFFNKVCDYNSNCRKYKTNLIGIR